MKKLIKPGNYLLVLFLATAFTVAACSTTGMQRSEDVQSTMQTVDNDIKLIVVQLDAIGASLDELIKPGQADVKRAFDLYSDNVSKIKKMENDFAKHANEMETSGENYFAEWDKDSQRYDNPEIQQQSNERRAALGQIYDKIAQNNIGVKEAFRTYVRDVNEIETFLSNDLTSLGINSISPIATKVVSNGRHLRNELNSLQAAIEDARSEMRQTGITAN
jgi:predicted small secreted protein